MSVHQTKLNEFSSMHVCPLYVYNSKTVGQQRQVNWIYPVVRMNVATQF